MTVLQQLCAVWKAVNAVLVIALGVIQFRLVLWLYVNDTSLGTAEVCFPREE